MGYDAPFEEFSPSDTGFFEASASTDLASSSVGFRYSRGQKTIQSSAYDFLGDDQVDEWRTSSSLYIENGASSASVALSQVLTTI